MKTFPISATQALKASRILTAKLGTPETESGFIAGGTSHHFSQALWRFRRDDGTPEARLGFGATRKTVSIVCDEKHGQKSFAISVSLATR